MKKIVLAGLIISILVMGGFSTQGGNCVQAADKKVMYAVGGAGATSWVYGMFSVWAETLNPILKKDGVSLVVQVTAGSRVHPQLYKEKAIEFGCSSTSLDYDQWNGEGDFKGKPFRDALLMFPINGTFAHVVTLEGSGITKLQDLNGKKIALGPQGFRSQQSMRKYFGLSGIKADYIYGDLSECFQMLEEKRVAAVGYTTGAPFAQVMELAATHKVRLIGWSKEEAQKVINSPGNTGTAKKLTSKHYDFLKEPVTVIAGYQTMDVRSDVPADHVYKITKATWENWGKIQNAVAACKVIGLEDVPGQFKPYHLGAIKYYDEAGIKIPKNLRP